MEGILAFAERVRPRAADLWTQASLDQRQRFQQLFFPNGITFGGRGFVGTAVTARGFSYLQPTEGGNERMVGQLWKRVGLRLHEAEYSRFQTLGLGFTVTVPLRRSARDIKIAVHDHTADRLGTAVIRPK